MARNPYRQFIELQPSRTQQVVTVIAVDGGVCTVQLPGGGVFKAFGQAALDDQVFVRDGVIDGAAPSLPYGELEI